VAGIVYSAILARDSHELFQWLSGGSYEVECGITGLYVRQPLLSGIYDVLKQYQTVPS
jgi:hypothetical protein